MLPSELTVLIVHVGETAEMVQFGELVNVGCKRNHSSKREFVAVPGPLPVATSCFCTYSHWFAF
jgi:hypothetical protein